MIVHRCHNCGTPVHPIFDWSDARGGRLICDECLKQEEDNQSTESTE